MPPRGPTVETIRYAAKRAVARSSLRKVAAEMGMAVSWLNAFVEGKETALRSQTRRLLREWFLKHARELAEQSAEAAGAALEYLVEGVLDEEQRRRAYRTMLRTLASLYADAGGVPDWLRELLDEEERGSPPRR